MGKRTTARRLAMQALFQTDLSECPIEQALEDVLAGEEFIDETQSFSAELAKGAWQNRVAIDQLISSHAIDWSMDRMGVVDRNILRLAVFELKFDKQTPPSVVINEAVELAKKFGSDESPKFINGILGAFAKEAS